MRSSASLPRRPAAAVLLEHRRDEHPCAARHHEAHPDLLALRWKIDGFLPSAHHQEAGKETVRNLLGFKDGTANPDAATTTLMDRIVWVQAGSGEPAWTAGGSYQVVRIIRMFVERWDRTPLQRAGEDHRPRQGERRAARRRPHEHDMPDYAADPEGRAHPARRPYPPGQSAHPRDRGQPHPAPPATTIRAADNAGQLDMGLLFVCFQADLAAGFLAVQARLNGEPLEEYIKPSAAAISSCCPAFRRRTISSPRASCARRRRAL